MTLQALVLVGGKGTRLQPLTSEIPKPILTLVDRPFMRYMIEWLGSHGVDEVVLACGFLPDQLQGVLGDGGEDGPRLRYLVEPEPLGTAGAIKFAAPYLADRFFALNGDVLTDLDLTALWEFHEERQARVSLGLYPVDDPSNFGLVDLNQDGSVRDFHEKPDPGHVGSGLVSAGAYVIDREALDLVPEDRKVSIEHEVFPLLVGDGLYGLRLDGYWKDIGTPERYLEATWDIIENRVETAAAVDGRGVYVSPEAQVSSRATIGPRTVIAGGCRVGDGARISDSVLLEGCRVGEDAVISDSIFAPGVSVASGVAVGETVIGKNGHVDA
jgi:mannose-1-phosphate guanylyltransferase